MKLYGVLKDKKVVPVSDMLEWAKSFETTDRQVGLDFFNNVQVSTIFLGLNHSVICSRKPLWFETVIFGGKHDGYRDRYSTWDEAVAGHEKAVALVKGKRLKI